MKKFSPEERTLLLQNKYVLKVGKNITYSEEFKEHFINERRSGKGAIEIFEECGLSKDIITAKRIYSYDQSLRSEYLASENSDFKDERGKCRSKRFCFQPDPDRAVWVPTKDEFIKFIIQSIHERELESLILKKSIESMRKL